MAMTERDDDRALDALFAAARTRPPEPPADLLARVLADAAAVQTAAPAPAPVRVPTRPGRAGRGGAWRGLLDLVGGWGGLGGLVAAGVTGVWIGFTGTGALGLASGDVWGTTGDAAASVFDAGDFLSLTLALEGDA